MEFTLLTRIPSWHEFAFYILLWNHIGIDALRSFASDLRRLYKHFGLGLHSKFIQKSVSCACVRIIQNARNIHTLSIKHHRRRRRDHRGSGGAFKHSSSTLEHRKNMYICMCLIFLDARVQPSDTIRLSVYTVEARACSAFFYSYRFRHRAFVLLIVPERKRASEPLSFCASFIHVPYARPCTTCTKQCYNETIPTHTNVVGKWRDAIQTV